MNKIFLALIVVLFIGCKANSQKPAPMPAKQTAIKVTGQFKDNYQVPEVSRALQRLLFVLENADMVLPERGYYLHLSNQDAKKMGTEDILLIPLSDNSADIYYTYDKNFSFDIYPIPGLEDSYYTKYSKQEQDDIKANQPYPESIFTSASLRDTLEWGNFLVYEDQRDIAKWINKLDSKEQIVMHNIGCAETTTGYLTLHSYDKMTLSELAAKRLENTSNAMEELGAPQEGATKAQWKKWIDSVQNLDIYSIIPTDNKNHYSIEFNEANSENIYGLDETLQKITRLNVQANFLNFKDQQVVSFDVKNKNLSVGNIFSPKQRDASYFVRTYVNNDTLYTVNKYFNWAKYVREKTDTSDFYKLLASSVLLKGAVKPAAKYSDDVNFFIDHSWCNDQLTYLLYHKGNTRQYSMMVLITQTGRVISEKSLNEELGNPKELEHLPFSYDQENTNGFAILMKVNGIARHLRFNLDLTKLGDVNLGNNFRWYPRYVNAVGRVAGTGKEFYYDEEDGFLEIYSLEGTAMKTISINLPDHVYDHILMMQDGTNFRLFYEYGDAFAHGIKTVLLDGNTFQLLAAPQPVYSAVQAETESSENTPADLNVFRLQNKWVVCFSIYNEWHCVVTETQQ